VVVSEREEDAVSSEHIQHRLGEWNSDGGAPGGLARGVAFLAGAPFSVGHGVHRELSSLVVLRQLRTARGWTQAQLARRAGITVPYLSMLESGVRREPSLSVLRRLARALGVPTVALLGRTR
jgi:DNA-binding XRE family transcriptional regulator